jgi:hypothetical protein
MSSRKVLETWLENGVLYYENYFDKKNRRDQQGLHVNDVKRPGPRL